MMVNQVAFLLLLLGTLNKLAAEQCGIQADGAICANEYCCSSYGYCGLTEAYCGSGCQSNCDGGGGGESGECVGLSCIINSTLYSTMFPNRNEIYTHDTFGKAGRLFPQIGTEGSEDDKLREAAAFAAHVTQETSGLYYVREIDQSYPYCDSSNTQFPCQTDEKYFGRGPLQLSWNYNYGAANASGIGADILELPEIVAQNSVISFRSAFWFWTRTDHSIPSIHDVIVGKWTPTAADDEAGRKPGFGMTINILNGGIECSTPSEYASNRIEYYKKFCTMLGVDPGENLDCESMKPLTQQSAE